MTLAIRTRPFYVTGETRLPGLAVTATNDRGRLAQAASDLHRLTVAASTAPAAIYGSTRVTFESFAFV